MTIGKSGITLSSLEAWIEHAGPKSGENHWVDGRSAKECARAWLAGGSSLPPEVEQLVRTSADFGQVHSWRAEPEARLRFDKLRGEPRNSDLLVRVEDDHGPYVMAVEAKADEPFGETVAQALAAAEKRRSENPRSRGVTRIEQLVAALLGRHEDDPLVAPIRYQLLTACAGAVAEAERSSCRRALMLVHEFVSDRTTSQNHQNNTADLDRFVNLMSHGAVPAVEPGVAAGPFEIPYAPLFNGTARLFIAKVQRDLRKQPAK